MTEDNNRMELFFSYSHKDEALRVELEKHLSILRRQGVLTNWHDRKIQPGVEWKGEIDSHIRSAGVVLLLISADFLASDYCYDREMHVALERHESGAARVIPVIIRSVDWAGAPFGKLQVLPKDGKPVVSWEDQDEAFTNIAQGIRSAISELTKSDRKNASSDVKDILRKFELRPKKYAGQEFIATVRLEDNVYPVDKNEARCFGVNLGDAIYRRCLIENPDSRSLESLFAQGEIADWLEGASEGRYLIRIRLLFGTFTKANFTDEGMVSMEESMSGFQLMEVIEELPDKVGD